MPVWRSVKRSFWRGLAALLPALLTITIAGLGISFVYKYAGQYVNQAIIYVAALSLGCPAGDVEAWYNAHWFYWVGVVVAIVGVCAAAYLLGTFLGNRIVRIAEAWLMRMPLLRRIYPGAKQVSEFLFSERAVEFRRVVAIEYPRRGVWSIGFVTGRSFRALCETAGQEFLTVFIPSSPTPVTGYVVAVPRREVVDLPITVDEALQYTISGGVILPPAERLESLEVALMVSRGQLQGAEDTPAPTAAPRRSEETPPATEAADRPSAGENAGDLPPES